MQQRCESPGGLSEGTAMVSSSAPSGGEGQEGNRLLIGPAES